MRIEELKVVGQLLGTKEGVVAMFENTPEGREAAEVIGALLTQITAGDNFALYWGALQKLHHEQMQSTGFDDKPFNFGEAIALMHSELSEALEYDRKGNGMSDHIPAFFGVEEELADVVLRIMHLANLKGLRIAEAVKAKMAFNATRPRKHGGKRY